MEMEMAEVLEKVGKLINCFAIKIQRKCGLEFEEAQQLLMIRAWKASLDYEPEIHLFGFSKYASTMLFFETSHIIQRVVRRHVLRIEAVERLAEEERTEIPDIMDLIIDRVAYQQIVERLPWEERRVRELRSVGYNMREIAKKMNHAHTWVHKVLSKKVKLM